MFNICKCNICSLNFNTGYRKTITVLQQQKNQWVICNIFKVSFVDIVDTGWFCHAMCIALFSYWWWDIYLRTKIYNHTCCFFVSKQRHQCSVQQTWLPVQLVLSQFFSNLWVNLTHCCTWSLLLNTSGMIRYMYVHWYTDTHSPWSTHFNFW